MNRREFIQSISAVSTLGISGCMKLTSQETTTSELERLTFSGEVTAQSDSNSPAKVRAELGYEGDQSLELEMGPTLLFSDFGEPYPGDGTIILYPKSNIGDWPEPYQSESGCWRLPEDGQRYTDDSIEWYTVSSENPVSESYSLITVEGGPSCLPDGNYDYVDKVIKKGSNTTARLNLGISASSNLISVDSSRTWVKPQD